LKELKEKNLSGSLEVVPLDVSDFDSVRAFVAVIRDKYLSNAIIGCFMLIF